MKTILKGIMPCLGTTKRTFAPPLAGVGLKSGPARLSLMGLSLCVFVGCAADSETLAVGTETEGDEIANEGEAADVDAEDGPSMTAVQNVLAQVTFENGTTVRFIELDPGMIVIRERGFIDGGRVISPDMRELDVVALYERLAGDSAPQALRDAVAHIEERPATDPIHAEEAEEAEELEFTTTHVPASAPVALNTQKSLQAISSSAFVREYCSNSPYQRHDWVSVTGDGDFYWPDMYRAYSYANAQRGNIRYYAKYRPWYTWRDIVDETIPQGMYDSASYVHGYGDADFKAAVRNADGDIYNFCSWGIPQSWF